MWLSSGRACPAWTPWTTAWSASPWTTPSCHQKTYAPSVTLSSHGCLTRVCKSHSAACSHAPRLPLKRDCLKQPWSHFAFLPANSMYYSCLSCACSPGMVSGAYITMPFYIMLNPLDELFDSHDPFSPHSHIVFFRLFATIFCLFASNVDQTCLFADTSLTAADNEAQPWRRGCY